MSRFWIVGSAYAALLLSVALGSAVLVGCSRSNDGEITPDVAARLETRARDAELQREAAARAASDAAKKETAMALPAADAAGEADCLELLDEGAYGEALAACTQALSNDPENSEIQKALELAREEASAAPAGMAEAAEGELDGALGSMQ